MALGKRRQSTGNRGSGTAEGAEPLPRRLPRSRSRRGKGSAMHLHRDQARDVNGPSLTSVTSEPGPGLSPATSASATGSAGLTPPHLRQIWGHICIRTWLTRQRIMRSSDGDVRCGHLVGNATSRHTSALGPDRSHDDARSGCAGSGARTQPTMIELTSVQPPRACMRMSLSSGTGSGCSSKGQPIDRSGASLNILTENGRMLRAKPNLAGPAACGALRSHALEM